MAVKSYDLLLNQLMQTQGDAFIEKAYPLVLILNSSRGKTMNTKHMDFIPLLTSLWILRSTGVRIDTAFVNIKDNLAEIEEVLDRIEELCDKLAENKDDHKQPYIMVNNNAKA